MKFLTKSTDMMHLQMLKQLLEANGIPAVIKGENTARMVSPFLMTEPSLWVFLDEQWPEAEKLILDPDYEVTNKIDVDEFYRLTRNTPDKHMYDTLLNWVSVFVVLLIALILLPKMFPS